MSYILRVDKCYYHVGPWWKIRRNIYEDSHIRTHNISFRVIIVTLTAAAATPTVLKFEDLTAVALR